MRKRGTHCIAPKLGGEDFEGSKLPPHPKTIFFVDHIKKIFFTVNNKKNPKKCLDPFNFFYRKKNTPKKHGIGASIRIGREIQCLPYAGFFYPNLISVKVADVLASFKFLFRLLLSWSNTFYKLSNYSNALNATLWFILQFLAGLYRNLGNTLHVVRVIKAKGTLRSRNNLWWAVRYQIGFIIIFFILLTI